MTPERKREYHRTYRAKNPDKIRAIRRKYEAKPKSLDVQARRLATYRKHNLKRYWGLTPEAYEALLQSQNGGCAVCKAKQGCSKSRLHVDHDHLTGRIRGLLCTNCNLALGNLKEDLQRVDGLARYIMERCQ